MTIMNPKDINKKIVFSEEDHVYKNEKGEILTSSTQLLSKYKKPFDETGIIAKMCAKREGISTAEILKRWEDKKNASCVHGTAVHLEMETWINTGIIPNNQYRPIVEELNRLPFDRSKLLAEVGLNSRRYMLAGTADILENISGRKYKIHDLKNTERFDLKPKYGNKFTYPLSELNECHLTTYSLQILLYGEMIKEWGFDFEPGWILHVNRVNGKIDKYDVLDLRKEVDTLLDHYLSMDGWW